MVKNSRLAVMMEVFVCGVLKVRRVEHFEGMSVQFSDLVGYQMAKG
jgi:hypothetical protein